MSKFNCELSTLYIYYKDRYNMLIRAIYVLSDSVESDERCYIRTYTRVVIDETFQFDGYVECLFDLDFITEDDLIKLWYFTREIRNNCNEIPLYLDNTIDMI